jgi:gamma-glutamyltranspeptidase
LNESITQEVREQLTARGHEVSTTEGVIGDPVMVYLDHAEQRIYAAGDPRAGRHAAALP